MNKVDLLSRLYNDYTKKFLNNIIIAGFFSILVAGSTSSGQSTSELDTSESGTGAGLKQIGISVDPDNSDTSAANANAYCVFSTGEHIFKLITAV